MARDRQRAKQRRARRRETVPGGAEQRTPRSGAQGPGAGPIDHGSAGADEAAARLALGAEAAALPAADGGPSGEQRADVAPVADDDAGPTVPGRGADGHDGEDRVISDAAVPARRPEASRPAPLRAVGFLRNCWAELQRVQWPDRRQVGQATGVVLLFVIIAGAYLGLADAVAQKIVDAIL